MKKYGVGFSLLFFFLPHLKAQETPRYSKNQIHEDIVYFLQNAEEIHPNLYHCISRVQLNRNIDSLLNTLPDSLSVLRTYRAFAETTAFIGEGHTGTNLPKEIKKQLNEGTFQSIPLQVTDYENNYFEANLVTKDTIKKGIKVRAINGIPSKNIFKEIIALKGGLPSFKKISAINYFRFYLTAIGISSPYVIDYEYNGNKYTNNLNSISDKEFNKKITKKTDARSYTFNIIITYGYLNIKSMVNYEQFTRFCDSVFMVIDNQHVQKLVIDLRENGGGNSELGRYLLDYLTDKPYRMAGSSERKVSQQFKDHIEDPEYKQFYGGYEKYLKMPNGSLLELSGTSHKPLDHAHKYHGRLCFLIGAYTFSSANMLAATIKDFKLSTLIGEPTGEPGNDYGELCDVKLPETNFICFTSTTFFARPNNNKSDNQAIIPDYLVKRDSKEQDNCLKFALEWLKPSP